MVNNDVAVTELENERAGIVENASISTHPEAMQCISRHVAQNYMKRLTLSHRRCEFETVGFSN